MQQAPRVALGVAEDVAWQVFTMRADEYRSLGRNRAHHEHEMLALIHSVAIDARAEFAEIGWQPRLGDKLDHRLVAEAILDDVGDCNDFQAVDTGDFDQVV